MTNLEFLKGMKKLSNYFLKDMNEDEIKTWYETFMNCDVVIFYMAIQEIGMKNKRFPVCAELVEEYKNQIPVYLGLILENNKSIPAERKKYLTDLLSWFSLKKEYPKEFLEEIFSYRKAIDSKKNPILIGYANN